MSSIISDELTYFYSSEFFDLMRKTVRRSPLQKPLALTITIFMKNSPFYLYKLQQQYNRSTARTIMRIIFGRKKAVRIPKHNAHNHPRPYLKRKELWFFLFILQGSVYLFCLLYYTIFIKYCYNADYRKKCKLFDLIKGFYTFRRYIYINRGDNIRIYLPRIFFRNCETEMTS